MFQVQDVPIRSQCVAVPGTKKPGYSSIYRNNHTYFENGGELITTFRSQPDSRTLIDVIRVSSVKWADCACVGERIKKENGEMGEYQWISYQEFYQRCLAFGRGMLELGLKRGDHVGIYSVNSIWWELINFGASSVGISIVPIYDSLGKTAAEYIIGHAEVKTIFTSEFKLKNTIEICKKLNDIKHIVIMESEYPDDFVPTEGIDFKNCQEILESGQKSELKNEFSEPDDVAIIMYTSGSTGVPKGCPLTHRNIIAGSASFVQLGVGVSPNDVYLSFLPLAHIYAVVVEMIAFGHGARVGYTRGLVKYLMDDIGMLRPTAMICVPRVLNKIADAMKEKISQKSKFLQKLIYWAIDLKAKQAHENRAHSLLLDYIIFDKFKAALGGRMRLVVNGGAPIMQNVFDFIQATVTPNVLQGYGLTETSAGVAAQEIPVADPRTVGPVGLGCEIRVRAVPNTDYDAEGDYPTGELQVRGPIVFSGYYRAPELNEDAFDEDGFFNTGDVVQITESNELLIIDRAKHLVKLSQGEYISLTSLNETYSFAKACSFVYIYADSMHDLPIAMCVPKPELIEKWKAAGIEDITKDETVKKEILASLEEVLVKHKLRGFERIKKVIIETEEPTIENGLLTPSMKPQYAALKRKYEKQFLELYDE
jgi:long-chain acyl-CoA synthetase